MKEQLKNWENYDLSPPGGQMLESSWRALYEAAVLEVDPNKFEICLKAAEQAICTRLASLSSQVSRDERLAMIDALSALRVLKQDQERKAADERKRHKTA